MIVFEWSSTYIQWILELLIAISLWSSFKNNIYKKRSKKKINIVLRTYKFTEYLSTLYASWSFVHVKDMCTSHGGTIIIGHHIHNTISDVIHFSKIIMGYYMWLQRWRCQFTKKNVSFFQIAYHKQGRVAQNSIEMW